MRGATIGSMIEAQSESAGDAPAIEGIERPQLTYGELAVLVRETAATLRAFGIGPGDRVAVVLPNGPEMATTFLSVAAAATCAPLNPEYRAEEFEFYLSDLHASALILASGSDSPAAAVARARNIPILELAPGRHTLSGPRGSGKGGFAGPDDIALILHTSGTTSRPKMVPLSHANLCASARNVRDSLALGPEDRCLNVLPLFHIHGLVCATLGSIAAGGSVACSPGFHPIRFFEWLDIVRPTWFTAVPTMHQGILARVDGHREAVERSRLRFIRSCSSALPPQVLAGMEKVFGAPVIEAYGMTEAAHQMASNPLPPGRRKPGTVGVAAGPEVAIMDQDGELLPPGSAGEIVIRGQNVTRGYEANPEANAGAFSNGWFRTGDLGVLDSEGYLTITGRLKEIINRGGEKIAPREIDEVLLDHPAIAQAVAFAVPDPALGEEVGAAVVRESGAKVSERELRSFAAVKLASFKVPRHVVFVDEIPKGPTGKLQRIGLAKKLGLPRDDPAPADDREPRSDIERDLASIWARVLELDRVGVCARFLDLGGDSILAAQLLAEIRRELGVELGFEEIFESPTVAEMAKVVESRRGSRSEWTISRRPQAETAPVSFQQEWRLHYDSRWPDHPISNRPSSIHLLGPLDPELLDRSLDEVIRRHEALRTTIRPERTGWVQRIHPPAPLHLPRVDLRHLPVQEAREETARLGLEDARRPIDPGTLPLLRAKLVRLAATEHVLLLTIHHLFFDGWSMSVLVRDLAASYAALAAGRTLPALPIQYGDYAQWQRRHVEDSRYEELRASWSRRLVRPLPPLALAPDRPRPDTPRHRSGFIEHRLPKKLTDEARVFSREREATLFMSCLAAFQAALHLRSRTPDMLLGCLSAGRELGGLEDLVGYFVNVLVLRTDLSGDPTLAGLLDRARRSVLETVAGREFHFLSLLEMLDIDPASNGVPLASVHIQMRNFPEANAQAGELQMKAFSYDHGVGRFDLTFDLVDRVEGLYLPITYNLDLYDRDTAARLIEDFERMLDRLVHAPDSTLSSC